MRKRILYITVSVIILVLIGGLIGLAFFINQQQKTLQDPTQDLGYFGGGSGTSSGGGLFGGLFGDSNDTGTTTEQGSGQSAEPVLRQLYNLPVAGFIKRRDDAVRFVDRATGHIFEKELPDGTTTRVNQTTVPQVYNAVFVNDGTAVIRQYLDANETIISVYNRISSSEAGTTFAGDVRGIVASPDGSQLAVLEETSSGSVIYVADQDNSSQRIVFESSLRNWNMLWEGETILISQKPSGSLPGSVFAVDPTSGNRQLLLQQRTGVSALMNPSGTYLLYSTVQNGVPTLNVENLATGQTYPVGSGTLAEKCVWHPSEPVVYCAFPNTVPVAQYPDAWHRGEIHFTDSLFKINVETQEVVHVLSPASKASTNLDMEQLVLSSDASMLFFTNARDKTLWSITFPTKTQQDQAATGNTALEE